VPLPFVTPWVKKPDDFAGARVNAGDVRSLETIAEETTTMPLNRVGVDPPVTIRYHRILPY
jgi:hypothetical protein